MSYIMPLTKHSNPHEYIFFAHVLEQLKAQYQTTKLHNE
jgi:hypothetical protein